MFWFIIILVLLNTCVLATEHYNQPEWLEHFQEITNMFFVVLFTLEMILKMYALGFQVIYYPVIGEVSWWSSSSDIWWWSSWWISSDEVMVPVMIYDENLCNFRVILCLCSTVLTSLWLWAACWRWFWHFTRWCLHLVSPCCDVSGYLGLLKWPGNT